MNVVMDLIKYVISFHVLIMIFIIFINYIVLKMYFLKVLKKEYYEVLVGIGSPKFWQITENIENILSLEGAFF